MLVGWYRKGPFVTVTVMANPKGENVTQPDDWLAEEKRRFGRPVEPEGVHRGYDALLDAWEATREAEARRGVDDSSSGA